jgi:3-hydroxyisobutyrate dehydrogenase
MSKLKIGFLGLGIMGSGMARRLMANGFPVAVYNRNAKKAEGFAEAGARVATSPCDAASGADVVICMVADDAASRAMWLGDQGALAAVAPGAICIDASTLTVGWVRELAAAVEARKCEFLDTPVTGSKAQAASGELNFLVGGSPATLEKARPVLQAMSKSITPIGPVGSGALIKLINNFVCGVQIVAIAEAITMIERSGLDRTRALEVLTNGAPGSPLVKTVSARMTAADYTPNFLLRLMTKDLNYALQEAEKLSVPLRTAAAAVNTFQRAIDAGHGEKDIAAAVELLRASAKPLKN